VASSKKKAEIVILCLYYFVFLTIAEGIILHKDGVIIDLNAFGKSEILWFNDIGQSER
jgi:hypothetical protein